MSVGDFAAGLLRDARGPDRQLDLHDHASELLAGAGARAHWLACRATGGTAATTIAGRECTYPVESVMDARRARTLLGEYPLAEWLFADVTGGDLFWDVGAFHGHYSAIAANWGCAIRAFEPHPSNRDRLHRTLELNGRGAGHPDVAVDGRALSATHGTVRFGGPSSSECGVGETDSAGVYREIETVPGDDILELPDLVKVDVEGHEAAVLDGMAETLEHVDRILLEVHADTSRRRIEQQLHDAGLQTQTLPCRRSQTYVGGVRR